MRRFSNEKLRGYGLTFAVLMQMIVAACNGEARNYNSDNSNANNGRPAETTDLETANLQPSAEAPTAPALAPTNTQESGGTTDSSTTPVEPENQDNSETEQPTAEVPTAPALAPTPTQEEGGDSLQQTQEELSMPSLEELTMENAPSISELEILTGQEGFENQIVSKNPEAEGRVEVINIEKLGLGDESRGIDSANMIVYGLKESGVVLAVYNIEANVLEHAVGGNKIDHNGQEITLPFTIYAINDGSMEEQYDGKTLTYQYGLDNENIPDIQTAQKSIVKALFVALVLEQSKNSYECLKDVKTIDLTSMQREEILLKMIDEFLAKFTDEDTIRIKGIEFSTSQLEAVIFQLNYQFRRAQISNQYNHEGDKNALSIQITSELWNNNGPFYKSLGGHMSSLLRTDFINQDLKGWADQDFPSSDWHSNDFGYLIPAAFYNMKAQELLNRILAANPNSSWDPTKPLPDAITSPGADDVVSNRMDFSTNNLPYSLK